MRFKVKYVMWLWFLAIVAVLILKAVGATIFDPFDSLLVASMFLMSILYMSSVMSSRVEKFWNRIKDRTVTEVLLSKFDNKKQIAEEFRTKDSIPGFRELRSGVGRVWAMFELANPKHDSRLADSLHKLLSRLESCRAPMPEDIVMKISGLHQKYKKFIDTGNFDGEFEMADEFIREFSKIMDDFRIRQIILDEEKRRQGFDKSLPYDFDKFSRLCALANSPEGVRFEECAR